MFSPATVRLVGLLVIVALVNACGDENGQVEQPSPGAAADMDVPSWAHVAPEQIAEAKKHGVPVAFENDLGMRFVLIPAGTFVMGSPEDEEGRSDDETQHEVTITKPFYMQTAEVTMGQFRTLKPHDPDAFWGQGADWAKYGPGYWDDDRPATHVRWTEASDFATALSNREEERTYFLPTEAQWELACRGGTATAYWQGDAIEPTDANLDWRDEERYGAAAQVGTTTSVCGTHPPNPWGLYDMHGNVQEWCRDRYAPHTVEPQVDPGGPTSGRFRVAKGGGFCGSPENARAAMRFRCLPVTLGRPMTVGFRLVSPLPEPGE